MLLLFEEEARAEGLDARDALELGQLDDQRRAPQHLLVVASRREERVESRSRHNICQTRHRRARVAPDTAPGDGAAAAQPADRDEAEQPKRKRMRIRNGKSGDARRWHDDDDQARRHGA